MLPFILSLPLCNYIIGISLFKNHIILYQLYCFDAIICLNKLCIVSIFESRISSIENWLNRELAELRINFESKRDPKNRNQIESNQIESWDTQRFTTLLLME